MKFEITGKELEKLNKFKKKVKKKHGSFGTLEYTFTETGIGTAVSVYSVLDDKILNLTDYTKW